MTTEYRRERNERIRVFLTVAFALFMFTATLVGIYRAVFK